jgi:ParB family chromosome partitioning protein
MKQTLQQLEPVDVPLKNLLVWDGNVRTTEPDKSIQELAASIEAVGLLHGLVVGPIQRGKYPVIAGKRRLLALSLLRQQGKIAPAYKVPCRLLPPGTDLTEISLTENIQREPMFPLDECASFQTLIENGKSIADVAARFGYTEKTVQKRLALARLSPVLQDAFRAGSINLELLQAFTLTSDHQHQEQVWNNLHQWDRNPAHVRQLLSGGQIPATDPRARFVGLPAYEAAGGPVARDLFHDEDGTGVYCSDAALLDRLAGEKLEQIAHQIQAEGWRWVEIRLQTDYTTLGEFRRLEGKPLPLPDKLEKQRAKLERKQADLAEQMQNAPEDLDDDKIAELEEACNRVGEQIEALESQRTYEFSRKVKANCGVIVSVGDHGQPQCWYGLLRKEDQAIFDKSKTPKNAQPDDTAPDATADQEARTRESVPETGYSAALIETLTLEKTSAIAAELSQQPSVALAAVVHSLVISVLGMELDLYHSDKVIQLSTRQVNLQPVEFSAAGKALQAQQKAWLAQLPRSSEAQLWTWCLGQSSANLLQLLAFCAALTVNAVQTKTDSANNSRLAQANALATALHIDMNQWFTPTAANFFERISKSQIQRALTEAGKTPDSSTNTFKKAQLAQFAENQIAGTGWLPQPLRLTSGAGETTE